MRRVRAHKGWAMAALSLVGLVAAGAVVGLGGTGNGNGVPTVARGATPTMSAGVADVAPSSPSGGGAGGSASSGTSGSGVPLDAKGQIAPVPPGGGGTTPVVPGSPRIVRSADLRVKVVKGGFGSAFDRVASVAAAHGGFVSSSSTASSEDARSGDLTVRVPSDQFDAARQALSALGKVEGQSIRGEDVSGQLVDDDARLRNLQAQEDSLRTLLSQAKAVGDVLSVQSSLFNVRQQIEQLKAQKANLDQAASLSVIQVSLYEPGAPSLAKPADDTSLAHSLGRAREGMVAVVGGMVVVVGWLVPVAVLGLLVWGGSRLLRRRPASELPVT